MTGRAATAAVTAAGALICALAALLGVFFLPLHAGAVPLPVSALGAAAVLVLVPRGCQVLTGRFLSAMVPVLAWAVVTFALAVYHSPLYPKVPLMIWDWRLMVLLAVGGLAATVSLATLRPLPAVPADGNP